MAQAGAGLMGEAWRRFRRDRAAVAGAALIILVALAVPAAPWGTPHDPYQQYFDGLTIEGAPLPPNQRF